jgi:hypothetical protein
MFFHTKKKKKRKTGVAYMTKIKNNLIFLKFDEKKTFFKLKKKLLKLNIQWNNIFFISPRG